MYVQSQEYQTHARAINMCPTKEITGSLCTKFLFHSLYMSSTVRCRYIQRNVHFIWLHIIRLFVSPCLPNSHLLMFQFNKPPFSLEHWKKKLRSRAKNLSAFYKCVELNSTWLESSSLDCMGKWNTLKFGDLGQVVGGGLRIMCSWISGNVRGSTSRSEGNS